MPTNALSDFLSAGEANGGSEGGSQIDAILKAVRQHLGMEIAFASKYVGDRREFTHLSADFPLPKAPGDSEPVEETFCWHILQGRLPELIADAQEIPFAHTIPITDALPVGAHMNVPLRLSDGSVYGSFCCVSRAADHSLNARDLSTLKAFADLAAAEIERELEADGNRDAIRSRVEGLIERDELTIHFQPIHRLCDSEVIGVESLARFPDAASRPPSDWFNEAASVGLGVPLELMAVRHAIKALPYVPGDAYLSVNLSPEALCAGGVPALLHGIPSDRLVIEVTEHARVADYPCLRAALAELRDHARIAIDDVGAGYSGLRHILATAPDILKLDMSLTRDVDRDPARRALTQALVAFARDIGSDIVAEGVENEPELRTLARLGVANAQGFHLSRPMPAVALRGHFARDIEGEAPPAAPLRSRRSVG